jgi:hypothetical protein
MSHSHLICRCDTVSGECTCLSVEDLVKIDKRLAEINVKLAKIYDGCMDFYKRPAGVPHPLRPASPFRMTILFPNGWHRESPIDSEEEYAYVVNSFARISDRSPAALGLLRSTDPVRARMPHPRAVPIIRKVLGSSACLAAVGCPDGYAAYAAFPSASAYGRFRGISDQLEGMVLRALESIR